MSATLNKKKSNTTIAFRLYIQTTFDLHQRETYIKTCALNDYIHWWIFSVFSMQVCMRLWSLWALLCSAKSLIRLCVAQTDQSLRQAHLHDTLFFSRRGPLVNIVKIVPICWKRCQQTFYNELHACRFSRSSINLMHSTVNGPVFKPAVTLLKKVACVRSVIITINLYPCTNGNLSRSKECTFTGSYLFSSTVIASCETKRGDNNY